MTKDQIIREVWNNNNIKKYCKTICPQDYDELCSELIIQLYKMKYEKLLLAFNSNYIEYLCFTICKRIVYGNITDTGIFYKKNKQFSMGNTSTLMDMTNIDDEPEIDRLEKISELIEGEHWYGKTLFKLYYIEGYKLKDISEKYGINLKSVHYSISKIKENIKRKI